jgi:hypothetical protein
VQRAYDAARKDGNARACDTADLKESQGHLLVRIVVALDGHSAAAGHRSTLIRLGCGCQAIHVVTASAAFLGPRCSSGVESAAQLCVSVCPV